MLLTGLVDYHIHTRLCGHARGELEENAGEARAVGLLELGFADHFPLLRHDRADLRMSLEVVPVCYDRIARLRDGLQCSSEVQGTPVIDSYTHI
jgi:histidinol-phosphatase (PHP family)